MADSQVEGRWSRARFQGAQGKNMRRGQVVDMDVVANTGAVAGLVIGSIDLQRAPAQGRIDGPRNEVGLGVVVLTDFAVGVGPCGVEVTQ